MNRRTTQGGFTLLETTFVVAIFSIVTAAIFSMSISFSDSADAQNVKVNANDAARRMYLTLLPQLRSAQRASMNWNQLPGTTLTYKYPVDTDGNGTAVNNAGALELSGTMTIGPDTTDVNGDGQKANQLVRTGDGTTEVITSSLASAATITNPDGTTSTINGIQFRPWGNSLEVVLVVTAHDRRGRTINSTFRQIVTPRN